MLSEAEARGLTVGRKGAEWLAAGVLLAGIELTAVGMGGVTTSCDGEASVPSFHEGEPRTRDKDASTLGPSGLLPRAQGIL